MTAQTTRLNLQRIALELFLAYGYDGVSVSTIAKSAGVSHMTFFRHFPTKESVVVGDIFDPVLAAAVAAQPVTETPLQRTVAGIVAAMSADEAEVELGSAEFKERIRLIARTPSLRGAVWASTAATQEAIVEALVEGGAALWQADAAAGAALGAATAVLLSWADGSSTADAPQALTEGLTSLVVQAS